MNIVDLEIDDIGAHLKRLDRGKSRTNSTPKKAKNQINLKITSQSQRTPVSLIQRLRFMVAEEIILGLKQYIY